MAQDTSSGPSRSDHQKELVKLIRELGYRHGHWQVFADFAESAAIALSNAIDSNVRDKREERYMQIVGRYKREEAGQFPKMLANLTMALEVETTDILGRTFHDLELHNKRVGQFFSPYPLCRMMAKMTIGEGPDLEARIAQRGFVAAHEPCAGSGAMVIALAHEIRELGINYQRHLHVTAVDVDPKCVHMTYLQLSLLHVPAIVVHGNSLSLEEFDRWYTPAHILDGWNWKLRRQAQTEVLHEISHAEPEAVRPDGRKKEESDSQLTLF